MADSTECKASPCPNEADEHGYCIGHHDRIQRALEMEASAPDHVEGEVFEVVGYKYVKTEDNNWMPEHNHVVEQQLGRKLAANEYVVHRNGIGSDNRIENLELHFGNPVPSAENVEQVVELAIRTLLEHAPSLLNGFVEDRTVEYLAAIENEMNRLRGRLLGLIESFDLEDVHERACKATLKTLSYDMQANLVEILDE